LKKFAEIPWSQVGDAMRDLWTAVMQLIAGEETRTRRVTKIFGRFLKFPRGGKTK
jgi:hypothetical protein